jgi:Fe-S cluster biogenesis protein NfuA
MGGQTVAEDSHNHPIDVSAEERLQALLDVLSSYIEHYHGGWVRMAGFDGRVLKVELGGACKGCALSDATLHGWVAGTVRQFFPEVERVEAADA